MSQTMTATSSWPVTERWWSNQTTALEALSKVDDSKPDVGVGVALLGLHALGGTTVARLAASTAVSKARLKEELAATDMVDVAKAAGAALYGKHGAATPAYVAQRVVQWKADADDGAERMYDTLVAKGVAPPLALERTAAAYGLPPGPAMAYVEKVSAPTLPPIVVADAADRALQSWTSTVASVEGDAEPLWPEEEVTKVVRVEQFDMPQGMQQRTVNRDDHGRFAPTATSGAAKKPSAIRRRRQKQKRVAASKVRAQRAAQTTQQQTTTQQSETMPESLMQRVLETVGVPKAVRAIRTTTTDRRQRYRQQQLAGIKARSQQIRQDRLAQVRQERAKEAAAEAIEPIIYGVTAISAVDDKESLEHGFQRLMEDEWIADGNPFLASLPKTSSKEQAMYDAHRGEMAKLGEVTAFRIPLEDAHKIAESGARFTWKSLTDVLGYVPAVEYVTKGTQAETMSAAYNPYAADELQSNLREMASEDPESVLFTIPADDTVFDSERMPERKHDEPKIHPDALFAFAPIEMDPVIGDNIVGLTGYQLDYASGAEHDQDVDTVDDLLEKASPSNPMFEAKIRRDQDGQFATKGGMRLSDRAGKPKLSAVQRRRKRQLQRAALMRRPKQQAQQAPEQSWRVEELPESLLAQIKPVSEVQQRPQQQRRSRQKLSRRDRFKREVQRRLNEVAASGEAQEISLNPLEGVDLDRAKYTIGTMEDFVDSMTTGNRFINKDALFEGGVSEVLLGTLEHDFTGRQMDTGFIPEVWRSGQEFMANKYEDFAGQAKAYADKQTSAWGAQALRMLGSNDAAMWKAFKAEYPEANLVRNPGGMPQIEMIRPEGMDDEDWNERTEKAQFGLSDAWGDALDESGVALDRIPEYPDERVANWQNGPDVTMLQFGMPRSNMAITIMTPEDQAAVDRVVHGEDPDGSLVAVTAHMNADEAASWGLDKKIIDAIGQTGDAVLVTRFLYKKVED